MPGACNAWLQSTKPYARMYTMRWLNYYIVLLFYSGRSRLPCDQWLLALHDPHNANVEREAHHYFWAIKVNL